MFNLQANAFEIAQGIREDMDMQIINDGITITGFNVMSFNYPEEIQEMITRTASHSMVGDLQRYQQISMTDGIASGKVQGGGAASDMAGMMMGMNIANEMLKNMNKGKNTTDQPAPSAPPAQANNDESDNTDGGKQKPNFCPNCGTKTSGGNFCSNCGHKLV